MDLAPASLNYTCKLNITNIQQVWFGLLLQLKEDHTAPSRTTGARMQRDDSGEVEAFMREVSHLDMWDIQKSDFVDADGKALDKSLLEIEVLSQRNRDIYFQHPRRHPAKLKSVHLYVTDRRD